MSQDLGCLLPFQNQPTREVGKPFVIWDYSKKLLTKYYLANTISLCTYLKKKGMILVQ
jgi:hypothetical protein